MMFAIKMVYYITNYSHVSVLHIFHYDFVNIKSQKNSASYNVTRLPPGEKAAHRPLCELPGRGAESCGPRSGTQPHFLCVRQRGAKLTHAACAGHA